MAETVAPLLFRHPVVFLARQLGISRQRANKLLKDGRIAHACQLPDGSWMWPAIPSITPSSRGPAPGVSVARFYQPKPYKLSKAYLRRIQRKASQ